MTYEPKEREILDEIVTVLHKHYGERLSRVVLFGSRARRDHHECSDYDFLVVFKGELPTREERKEDSRLAAEICLKHEALTCCVAVSEDRYLNEKSALMMNVRKEGVVL